MSSSRRKHRSKRLLTLNLLVESLVGTRVVVELKNDAEVSGVLDEVDSAMNLSLVQVSYVARPRHLYGGGGGDSGQRAESHEQMSVRGSFIRYVHIPEHVVVADHMNRQRRLARLATDQYERQVFTAEGKKTAAARSKAAAGQQRGAGER